MTGVFIEGAFAEIYAKSYSTIGSPTLVGPSPLKDLKPSPLIYRINSKMNNHFQSVFRIKTDCMSGVEYIGNFSIDRGTDGSFFRFHSTTVSYHFSANAGSGISAKSMTFPFMGA